MSLPYAPLTLNELGVRLGSAGHQLGMCCKMGYHNPTSTSHKVFQFFVGKYVELDHAIEERLKR